MSGWDNELISVFQFHEPGTFPAAPRDQGPPRMRPPSQHERRSWDPVLSMVAAQKAVHHLFGVQWSFGWGRSFRFARRMTVLISHEMSWVVQAYPVMRPDWWMSLLMSGWGMLMRPLHEQLMSPDNSAPAHAHALYCWCIISIDEQCYELSGIVDSCSLIPRWDVVPDEPRWVICSLKNTYPVLMSQTMR